MKELPKPRLILADVRIDLAVSAFKIGVAHDRRAAMARARDIDHVEVVFFDDSIQVHINEILSRRRPPVAEQHVFHIRKRQWPLQQRIVVQINLPDREVVGRPPVGVHLVEQFGAVKSSCFHSSRSWVVPLIELRAQRSSAIRSEGRYFLALTGVPQADVVPANGPLFKVNGGSLLC